MGGCQIQFILAIVQFGVETTALEQFFVLALFNDVTVAHYQDQFIVAEGGQAMGDDEAGATDHQADQTKNRTGGGPHPILSRAERLSLRKRQVVEEK